MHILSMPVVHNVPRRNGQCLPLPSPTLPYASSQRVQRTTWRGLTGVQVRNLYVGKDFKGDVPLHLKIAAGLTTGALGICVASPTDLVKVRHGGGMMWHMGLWHHRVVGYSAWAVGHCTKRCGVQPQGVLVCARVSCAVGVAHARLPPASGGECASADLRGHPG